MSDEPQPRSRRAASIWLLALAYFACYAPYAALTKALTSGLLPASRGPVAGATILPATVAATIVVTLLVLVATGWWRRMGRRRIAGFALPFPGRWTLLSGLAEATIIGATTLAYTFEGVSIVFMMLLMRGGVLFMSPFVDRLHQRRIRWFSWLALALSIIALVVPLQGGGGSRMSTGAGLVVLAYLAGYLVRFQMMGSLAKSHERAANHRYFAEEQLVATPVLLATLALFALLGRGEVAAQVREGFTTFVTTPALLPALAIGALYGLLSVFGTLIYLDRNENTYAVPINRSTSLLAGVAAGFALTLLFRVAPPSGHQLVGAALLLGAAAVLAMGPRLAARAGPPRLVLFVCSGNTCRSAMAERLAMLEAARRLHVPVAALAAAGLRFASAGLTARVGEDLDGPARDALARAGAPLDEHRAQQLTVELLRRAEVVICLTPSQRTQVIAMAPWAASRTHLLAPGHAIELPEDGDYDRYAQRIASLVSGCFDRLELLPA